ncbi:MAG: myo-inosose-2 dehydratase [Pelagibacteraceae bacterium TMED216]|nr:MAG: myo-inosose-2 dehydratase [Pelagibacteraceae bacterium TMED216]|tara:strand:+ start:1088 stop:1987 length:900 start_codon:yes stop_codon:yes gene_type:complete
MSIKLGIAPIAWSNDDMPELGGNTSLEQCLHEASSAGFTGIESGGKFPMNSEELLPKLQKENLKLCSGWYGAQLLKRTPKEEFKLMQEQLKLFKDCNAPCLVFAEVTDSIQGDPNTPLSKRPKLSHEDWKKFTYSINELSKMLMDENMPLAYHHHMGTVIETEEDTTRLIENTKDTVKLLIDTGHMLFAQGNSLKLVEKFHERIVHVHCKDIRKNVLEQSKKNDSTFRQAFLDGAFTVPGDGCIDYVPFLKTLNKKNYSGWLVVEAEQDPAKANPFEYAKIGYKYLNKTAKDCGFEIIS